MCGDEDATDFEMAWGRFAPRDIIRFAVDTGRPAIGSLTLSQMLSNCVGLEGCEAVIVCELDDDGSIVNGAIARRTSQGGFVPQNSLLRRENGQLSVDFRFLTLWVDDYVVCNAADDQFGRVEHARMDGTFCEVDLRPGISVLFLGNNVSPGSILGHAVA